MLLLNYKIYLNNKAYISCKLKKWIRQTNPFSHF